MAIILEYKVEHSFGTAFAMEGRDAPVPTRGHSCSGFREDGAQESVRAACSLPAMGLDDRAVDRQSNANSIRTKAALSLGRVAILERTIAAREIAPRTAPVPAIAIRPAALCRVTSCFARDGNVGKVATV
jgi:hypothetical protein